MLSHNLESLKREVLLPTEERFGFNQLFPMHNYSKVQGQIFEMDWTWQRINSNYDKVNDKK